MKSYSLQYFRTITLSFCNIFWSFPIHLRKVQEKIVIQCEELNFRNIFRKYFPLGSEKNRYTFGNFAHSLAKILHIRIIFRNFPKVGSSVQATEYSSFSFG